MDILIFAIILLVVLFLIPAALILGLIFAFFLVAALSTWLRGDW